MTIIRRRSVGRRSRKLSSRFKHRRNSLEEDNSTGRVALNSSTPSPGALGFFIVREAGRVPADGRLPFGHGPGCVWPPPTTAV